MVRIAAALNDSPDVLSTSEAAAGERPRTDGILRVVQGSRRSEWPLVGLALMGLALFAALAIRIADPWAAPPLYDGVIVVEPYIWLDPPPGQPGGALARSATVAVEAGQNRIVALATDEGPPQAQLLATPGALTLAQGATSLRVSITPVEPVRPVTDGYIDGNVYRFEVVDQLGRAATAPASAYVSIFLRAADPADVDATIERFDGAGWAPIATSSEGDAGFLAIVTEFGDFAVVGHGTNPYATAPPATTTAPPTEPAAAATAAAPTTGPSANPATEPAALPATILAAIAAIIVVAAIALLARRRRQRDDW
jgi:hypothetical protein